MKRGAFAPFLFDINNSEALTNRVVVKNGK
jgi:hypothetical protein